LDFSALDAEKQNLSHMAFMFKIIDDKKRIIGNPKTDNMVLFVKIENYEPEEATDESMCLGLASLLLDEGYCDSFDRCFKAITCCHGNVDEARALLRNVMVTENQY
jgi:hypothetical protein